MRFFPRAARLAQQALSKAAAALLNEKKAENRRKKRGKMRGFAVKKNAAMSRLRMRVAKRKARAARAYFFAEKTLSRVVAENSSENSPLLPSISTARTR